MPLVHKSEPKGINELTLEWDQLAQERDRQLRAGVDLSFRHVVAPTALRLLADADQSRLLDIGCGTGHFAALAAASAGSVLGIEPSAGSIDLAKKTCASRSNVRFVHATIEDFAAASDREVGSSAVALMVMMAAPNLRQFVQSVSSVLPRGAMFVTVVPHPCFWPTYWGYAAAPWFDYAKETFIEAPFAISGCQTNVQTTHIHRPLSQYIDTLTGAGFQLDVFEEPMPSPEVELMYPAPWAFPRFLAARWIKG